MQSVSFIHLRSGVIQCRETGGSYAIELVRGLRVGFAIIHEGEALALEASRADAMRHIEQHARLEFLTAQAECGQYVLDCPLAV